MARDCSWSPVGVQPDLSAWGKCIANGHPISALLGSDKAREAAGQIYRHRLVLVRRRADGRRRRDAAAGRARATTWSAQRAGRRLREGLQQRAAAHGFALRQTGPVQMPLILFEDDPDLRHGLLPGVAEMLKRGVYVHPWHNMFFSAAHSLDDIATALEATDDAFAAVKRRGASIEPHPVVARMLAPH